MILKPIRVLIVDDSALVRKFLTASLARFPDIEVVGTAADPYIARDKILELAPDVITLDIEMPRMDGLTFLKVLMQHRPMPVIIMSSLTQAGSGKALEALQAGAVDVMGKPSGAFSVGENGARLVEKIKAAAGARLRPSAASPATVATPAPARLGATRARFHPQQLILLGASTGGTEALKEILTRLPGGLPGIAIAQHIPPYFSRAFADRLAQACAFEVREAAQGDVLGPGLALVAPGDYHMVLQWSAGSYRVLLHQRPPVHHCRPAVDVLFRSAAECPGIRAVAAVLTGMGSDGALGLQALKAVGARTLAQDEATSVVYGMPRAAAQLGVVDQVLPLPQIAPALVTAAQSLAGGAALQTRVPVLAHS